MEALIRKIFEKASFHGFAYIARRDIHMVERITWGIVLCIATYYSVAVCWDQWKRYKKNPVVLGVERIIETQEFPYMGVTLCPNYFDEKQAENIILTKWNSRPDDTKYGYYMEFLRLLPTIQYDNFEKLEPYEYDSTVNDVDFLKTLWDIYSEIFTNKTGKLKHIGADLIYADRTLYAPNEYNSTRPELHSVITEVGLCVTTSFLHEYQNPLGFKREPEKEEPRMCSHFEECTLKILPEDNIGDRAVTYVHNNEDIVTQDGREVIRKEMSLNEVVNVNVALDIMSAEDGVRRIPIEYRKCRFSDENILSYFKIYRPILCRNECRINAALKLCKCKPFLYVVGPGPICDVQGMLCLAKAEWKNTKCGHCLDMCSVHHYIAQTSASNKFKVSRFARSMAIKLFLPKIGIRRQVVFSIDQLVVSFGGAASLFLGCSFLSFAQIIYYFIQYLEQKVKRLCTRFK